MRTQLAIQVPLLWLLLCSFWSLSYGWMHPTRLSCFTSYRTIETTRWRMIPFETRRTSRGPRMDSMTSCTVSSTSLSSSSSDSSDDTQEKQDRESPPDLFEYFDPLLSPHAYPDGISPDHQPHNRPTTYTQKSSSSSPAPPSEVTAKSLNTNAFGFELPTDLASETNSSPTPTKQEQEDVPNGKNEPDLFDYFDPTLSPHAYPEGIRKPTTSPIPQQLEEDEERYNPLKITPLPTSGDSTIGATTGNDARQSKRKVGILLMDHGSRNEKSNQRLERLAELYQLSLEVDSSNDDNENNDSSIVAVEAAHMEIVEPSIPQGLQTLLDQGVDEIICHPYFLSPGRHVREDIPQIVQQAIVDLQITVPVVTTDPLGSNTQLMIGAIHSLVQETKAKLAVQQTNDNGNL